MTEQHELDPKIKQFLDQLPKPNSNHQHKAQVLSLMINELPQAKTRLEQLRDWYPMAVLLSQIRVIHTEIWFASTIVLGFGVLFTLMNKSPNGIVFTAIAPIVASISVALLYDENFAMMMELEKTTRASGKQLLLARLVLVFGFNLVLSLIGSVILAILSVNISLIPLISSWLAPMFFLSALAFFLSILLIDTFASVAFSLILWVINLLLRDEDFGTIWFVLLSMRGLSDPSNRPILMLAAGLLVSVTLWIFDIKDNQTRRNF